MRRLTGGLRETLQRGRIVGMSGLDRGGRLALLSQRLDERRRHDAEFDVPRESLEIIAERLTSGRDLGTAINRLHLVWGLTRVPLTEVVAETVARDLAGGGTRVDAIQSAVSRFFGVSPADLVSDRRNRLITWPRQIAMFLTSGLTTLTPAEIARRFGQRDRDMVMRAVRRVEVALADQPSMREMVDRLKQAIQEAAGPAPQPLLAGALSARSNTWAGEAGRSRADGTVVRHYGHAPAAEEQRSGPLAALGRRRRASADRQAAKVAVESDWERARVKRFSRVRGFGILTRGEGTPDVYVHASTLRRCGFTELRRDQVVQIRWGRGPKGCTAAEIRPDDASPRQ